MSAAIPNRPVFRSPEVCEIAEVQPYVLRTWESEFPDLGVAKTAGGPRMYRRADVERVLRIKHLLFVEGLTLSGARRKLSEESPATTANDESVSDADVAALIDHETRRHLKTVRQGLQWILGVLAGSGASASDFVLTPAVAAPAHGHRSSKKAAPAPIARTKQSPKAAAKKPTKKK
jgi:DNA-binding transcriptional MerR regulator